MRKIVLVPLIAFSVAASGCQTIDGMAQPGGIFSNSCKISGTALGAVLGAVGGAFIGQGSGRIVAIMAGAAAGGFLGNQIGSMLDCEDQTAAATAAQTAGDAPIGQRIVWASQPVPKEQLNKAVAAEPAPPAPAQKSLPAKTTAAKPASGAKKESFSVQEPPGPKAAPSKTAWAVQEPIRSAGNSGMWGWVEPVSAPAQMADGRTCRKMQQGIVDAQGKQTVETINACKDDKARWVVTG